MIRYVSQFVRVAAAAMFFVWLSYCIGFQFRPIQDGLDPSWISATSLAQSSGGQFGSDILFTLGPYMNVLYKYYQDGFSNIIMIATIFIVLIGTLMSYRLFDRQNFLYIILFLLFVFASPSSSDALLTLIPLFLVYIATNDETSSPWFTILGAIALSIIVLTKFSAVPTAVVGTIVIDVIRLSRRQFPIALISLVALTIAAANIVGMDVSGLAAYISSGLDVSTGYADSMNIPGPALEIWMWLGLAVALVAVLFIDRIARAKLSVASQIQYLAPIGMLLAVLLLSMKHGFVRHDGHSLIAWSVLIVAAGALMLIGERHLSKLAGAGIAVTAIMILQMSPIFASMNNFTAVNNIPIRFSRGTQEIGDLISFVANHESWSTKNNRLQSKTMAAIAAQHPVPKITGSVDTIPSIQSRLIASGLDLKSRPTIQEYVTYSTALIQANNRYYTSEMAPENVIFGLDGIDQRLPMFTEAALWPILLERYEPIEIVDGNAILHKRVAPLTSVLGKYEAITAQIAQPVMLPENSPVVFAKIDVSYSTLGKLLKTLFKVPELYIQLNYADMEPEKFRFVPGIAREGFLLSPRVKRADEFVGLSAGLPLPLGSSRPISFQILMPDWFPLAYNPEFTVQYSNVNLQPLKAASLSNSFLHDKRKRDEPLIEIVSKIPMHPPTLEASPEGIFAHASSQFNLDVSGKRQIDVIFGMRDGSWSNGGSSQGVCFSVETFDTRVKLFQHCLKPVENKDDRGLHSATIELPTTTQLVQFQTECIASCGWAWSYWSSINLL